MHFKVLKLLSVNKCYSVRIKIGTGSCCVFNFLRLLGLLFNSMIHFSVLFIPKTNKKNYYNLIFNFAKPTQTIFLCDFSGFLAYKNDKTNFN